MGRKLRTGAAREAKNETISDAGARTVSMKPFDAPKNADSKSAGSDCAIVNAARVDADGSRVVVATSDGVLRIIGVQFPDISYKIAELRVADDPDEERCNVWDAAWGSTRHFGSVLAACSEDRKIRIWRESGEEWLKWFEWTCEDKAGNALRWAPSLNSETITLAVGCSDGSVLILKHVDKAGDESGWVVENIPSAHSNGVTVIQWGPSRRMSKVPKPPPLLITGGADSLVKMWIPSTVTPTLGTETPAEGASWERESKLEGHQDWISDLAWAPCVGIRIRHLLASAGRDKKVILWSQPSPSAVWVPMLLTQTHEIPWSLSFSITGHMLSVSEADGRMMLWRENQGTWEETQFASKIRDYQEAMKSSSASAGKEMPSSVEPESVLASADSTREQAYPPSDTSGYKPEDYAQWANTPGYNYADYYAYYAKYAGKDHDRSLDYYGGDRSRYAYPYQNAVEGTPAEAHRNRRKPSETRGYDEYPERSSRDKYRSYRDY